MLPLCVPAIAQFFDGMHTVGMVCSMAFPVLLPTHGNGVEGRYKRIPYCDSKQRGTRQRYPRLTCPAVALEGVSFQAPPTKVIDAGGNKGTQVRIVVGVAPHGQHLVAIDILGCNLLLLAPANTRTQPHRTGLLHRNPLATGPQQRY